MMLALIIYQPPETSAFYSSFRARSERTWKGLRMQRFKEIVVGDFTEELWIQHNGMTPFFMCCAMLLDFWGLFDKSWITKE